MPDFNHILKQVSQNETAETKISKTDIERIIGASVSEDELQRVKTVLSDDKKVKALLESDAARELFKKLKGGISNGGF